MSLIALDVNKKLKDAINNAITKSIENGQLEKADINSFIIETPADKTHGDLATNAAMVNARAFKTSPLKIAESIIENINLENTLVEKPKIAGPGFINFFYSPKYYSEIITDIENLGKNYGKSNYGNGEKVMVEFVSANPTGPMHMGNARGGALGDCLAAVLNAAGYSAWREFYVNDAGNQIERFGMSLEARYLQIFKGDAVPFPEDGYQGSDITDLAQEYANINKDKLVNLNSTDRQKQLIDFALPKNIDKMKEDMAKYKVHYDKWFFESSLYKDNQVSEVIDILKKNNLTYEEEGALWYKNIEVLTKEYLKEGKTQKEIDNLELKDDVLIRNNGIPTYFAADIAYHKNKFDRGFKTCINVWGADHHGHVMRMKGAMNAIGYDGSKLHVMLMQLVKLVRDGEVVRMSKRTGKAIQLRDLLDEVPVDSVRFLFNTREPNTQMDFDLDLAVKQDSQNPVYYVQYAHARVCSIIRTLEKEGIKDTACSEDDLKLLNTPEELELISHLANYTGEIITSCNEYNPTKITSYVTKLATLFHKFYGKCRVQGDDKALTQARLKLCICVKTVINNALTMFNIESPEQM